VEFFDGRSPPDPLSFPPLPLRFFCFSFFGFSASTKYCNRRLFFFESGGENVKNAPFSFREGWESVIVDFSFLCEHSSRVDKLQREGDRLKKQELRLSPFGARHRSGFFPHISVRALRLSSAGASTTHRFPRQIVPRPRSFFLLKLASSPSSFFPLGTMTSPPLFFLLFHFGIREESLFCAATSGTMVIIDVPPSPLYIRPRLSEDPLLKGRKIGSFPRKRRRLLSLPERCDLLRHSSASLHAITSPTEKEMAEFRRREASPPSAKLSAPLLNRFQYADRPRPAKNPAGFVEGLFPEKALGHPYPNVL